MTIDGNGITDEEIRELLADRHSPVFNGKTHQIKFACEVALQKEPMPTSANRWRYDNARQICAEAWSQLLAARKTGR